VLSPVIKILDEYPLTYAKEPSTALAFEMNTFGDVPISLPTAPFSM
jgi:hypothetical protein